MILKSRFLRLFARLCGNEIAGYRVAVLIFVGILFFGAMFWAKSDDPFVRKWFKVKESRGKVECVAVLPKPARACPVVFYFHDSGGTLMTDGRPLRQMAELEMVTVSLEYNHTNYSAFEAQFSALWDHVQRQSWGRSKEGPLLTAWVAEGLGAQNALRFFVEHPDKRPQLFVKVGGGARVELEKARGEKAKAGDQGTAFLLLRGEQDQVFSAADYQKTADALSKLQRSSSVSNNVSVRIVPGLGHSFEPDRALVIRQIGEYIKAHLTPEHPLPEFPKPPSYPFLLCATPAFAWIGYWGWKRRQGNKKLEPVSGDGDRLTKWEAGLRVVAVVIAIWAAGETAIHLIPPRLEIGERTLQIARWKLLAPKWQEDFSALERMPIWKGQKLKTLLTHVELAHYCVYELINWKLPPEIYRDYVLSPIIKGSETELNWRRPLWEFYYPRIRKENTTESAAIIIARTLRERITVRPDFDRPQGVDTIWREQVTGEKGFEKIYVATLRSAGVPARLDSSGKAEFWDETQWRSAPKPLDISNFRVSK